LPIGADVGNEEPEAGTRFVAVEDQRRIRRAARGAARPQRERPLVRPGLLQTVGGRGQGGVAVERERGRPLAPVRGVEGDRAVVEAEVRLAGRVAVARRRRDVLRAATLERPERDRAEIVAPVDRRRAAADGRGGGRGGPRGGGGSDGGGGRRDRRRRRRRRRDGRRRDGRRRRGHRAGARLEGPDRRRIGTRGPGDVEGRGEGRVAGSGGGGVGRDAQKFRVGRIRAQE